MFKSNGKQPEKSRVLKYVGIQQQKTGANFVNRSELIYPTKNKLRNLKANEVGKTIAG